MLRKPLAADLLSNCLCRMSTICSWFHGVGFYIIVIWWKRECMLNSRQSFVFNHTLHHLFPWHMPVRLLGVVSACYHQWQWAKRRPQKLQGQMLGGASWGSSESKVKTQAELKNLEDSKNDNCRGGQVTVRNLGSSWISSLRRSELNRQVARMDSQATDCQ